MNIQELGKQAAEKQARNPALARTLGSLGTGLGRTLHNVGNWAKQKPISRGVLPALGAYAGGEGAVSALQGNESLGKQWDQSITRGQVEGGNLGGAKAYMGRLLTRPASTLYGSFMPYQRPDVSWDTSFEGGSPGSATGSIDEGFSRLAKQEAQLPYWLQLQQQQRQQAGVDQAEAYRRAQADLEAKMRELEQGTMTRRGLNTYEQGREAARSRLEQSLEGQGLPSTMSDYTPDEAQSRYEAARSGIRGGGGGGGGGGQADEGGGGREQPAPGSDREPGDPPGFTSNVDTRRSGPGVSSALMAAGLPMAGMLARRKEPTEEERLREAMRMYRTGR